MAELGFKGVTHKDHQMLVGEVLLILHKWFPIAVALDVEHLFPIEHREGSLKQTHIDEANGALLWLHRSGIIKGEAKFSAGVYTVFAAQLSRKALQILESPWPIASEAQVRQRTIALELYAKEGSDEDFLGASDVLFDVVLRTDTFRD